MWTIEPCNLTDTARVVEGQIPLENQYPPYFAPSLAFVALPRRSTRIFACSLLSNSTAARDTAGIMPTVHFTSHLQKFAKSEPVEVTADTVGAALQQALAGNDQLRTYVLDEHDRLRRHVTIFIDGQLIADRIGLSDSVGLDAKLYVMQALSGG